MCLFVLLVSCFKYLSSEFGVRANTASDTVEKFHLLMTEQQIKDNILILKKSLFPSPTDIGL